MVLGELGASLLTHISPFFHRTFVEFYWNTVLFDKRATKKRQNMHVRFFTTYVLRIFLQNITAKVAFCYG